MGGLDGEIWDLRRLIGSRCFVRRDRLARALFVSDIPRRLLPEDVLIVKERLENDRIRVKINDSLAFLDYSLARYERFFQTLEEQAIQNRASAPEQVLGLCRILEKHPAELDAGMLPNLKDALLMWDRERMAELQQYAGNLLAIALRTGKSAPGFMVPLLLSAQTGETRG